MIKKIYYPNGNLMKEIQFNNGEKNGIWKYYHETGELLFYDTWKDGILDGDKKVFYKNGKISRECPFKDGNPHGIARQYHENGNLFVEIFYNNGYVQLVRRYNERGEFISEGGL